MNTPYIDQLLIGKVKQVGDPFATEPMHKQWNSGMFKEMTMDKLWLSKTGLTGDEVADTKNHGGTEKAVFAYPTIHYDFWRNEQKIANIGIGAFGENLAVCFMDESTVCIGDSYQFGDAIVQVSQPRKPCWKPARRLQTKDLVLRTQESGKTGWYFRVLQEGLVQVGEELTLLERPFPKWTISQCNEVIYNKAANTDLVKDLVACEALAESMKHSLAKRL